MFDVYLKALAAWGPHPDPLPSPDHFQEFLEERYDIESVVGGWQPARDLIMRYNPRITDDNQLTFLPTSGGKKVTGKPGRMLRKMFPWLNDPSIEDIVTELKNSFMVDTSDWSYEATRDRIGEVYAYEQGRNIPLDTSGDFKELCNSCMRYDFDGQEYHPCDAYNSGDWELHYVLDGANCLVARAIVNLPSRTRGPIYACSQKAAEYLLEHVGHFPTPDSGDWTGSRMLVLRAHGYDDELAAPYLDYNQYGFDYCPQDDDMYMTVGGPHVNVDGDGHEGTQCADITNCLGCHENFNPNRPDSENSYCATCAKDLEECEESTNRYPPEKMVTVERFDGTQDRVHRRYSTTHPTEEDTLVLIREHYLFEEESHEEA